MPDAALSQTLIADLASAMRVDFLARKHGISEEEVNRLRAQGWVVKLRKHAGDGLGGFDEQFNTAATGRKGR